MIHFSPLPGNPPIDLYEVAAERLRAAQCRYNAMAIMQAGSVDPASWSLSVAQVRDAERDIITLNSWLFP